MELREYQEKIIYETKKNLLMHNLAEMTNIFILA